MNSELLTIVILSRDRPEFLEKCLRSVFENQKSVPEVILSDNSTQNHSGIETLRSTYPFTYVRQSGQLSMTEHHNACLKLPSTPWLWLVHDDDELHPESIAKVESFLAKCKNAALVVGGVQYIDERGKVIGTWEPKRIGTVQGEEAVLSLGLDFGTFSPGSIFTVAAAHKNGGFVEIDGVCADYPLSLRLAFSCGVAFLPELVGRHRLGHGQASDYSTREKAEAYLDFVVGEAEFIRTVECSRSVAEQIIDYATWETFLAVAPPWLQSHRSFVFRLARKCLRTSPRPGEWQNRVRNQYPFLFWPIPRLSWPLYQTVRSAVPAPLRRWIRAQL
jgi:Glycosyl transferase family 2